MTETGGESSVAFYCVSDEGYFLGAVGLINSLRMVGHTEPIVLLDCGLTARQRELLGTQATVVTAPGDDPPWLSKTIAPLRHPADLMILVDVDVIVTRSLDELITGAAGGSVVAFENNIDRFVPEWGKLLELGALRRQRYLSSGFIAVAKTPWERTLRLWQDRMRRVEGESTYFARNVPDYPRFYVDQDVLNAILASEVDPKRIMAVENRLLPAIPFEGLTVIDETSLRCAYADGTEPYALHHILPAKPWIASGAGGIYARLLRRLLNGPDVAVRVPRQDIPMQLRAGTLGSAERMRGALREQLRWRVQGFLRERLGVGGPGDEGLM
jgi:hypothetical protein